MGKEKNTEHRNGLSTRNGKGGDPLVLYKKQRDFQKEVLRREEKKRGRRVVSKGGPVAQRKRRGEGGVKQKEKKRGGGEGRLRNSLTA